MIYLDTKGLLCPEPILKINEKMKEISEGEIIEITSEDPGIVKDLPAWCKCSGNKIIKFVEKKDRFIFHIKKGG